MGSESVYLNVMLLMLVQLMMLSCVHGYIISVVQDDTTDGLTCWTCPNKTDNEACNNWAPDNSCPSNHTVCQTVHLYDLYAGRSISVFKRCAQAHQCTADMVGCRPTHTPGIQQCVSCCTSSYCNELIASDHSTALALSTFNSGARVRLSWTTLAAILFTLKTLFSSRWHCLQEYLIS